MTMTDPRAAATRYFRAWLAAGTGASAGSPVIAAAYRAALSITVAVALAAFVLSFAALRDLAVVWAGIAPAFAWLVPVVVDLSITGSTIALLALSGAERAQVLDGLAVTVPENVHDPRPSLSVADLIAREADTSAEVEASHAVHAADAERIVEAGVTRIDRVKVAEVLAEHARGVAPSMIARKLAVGYSTVVRILDHHTAQAAQVSA